MKSAFTASGLFGKTASRKQFYDTLQVHLWNVLTIPDPEKDWEDLTQREIYDIFAYRLRTPVEYKISKIQTPL